MTDFTEILARWDDGDGKPYKSRLIDWAAYEAEPENIGCMCAQGQVLALMGGWSPTELRDADQDRADAETAKLLNISCAHAVLLRDINDQWDGAPSIVLTNPGEVLGDQWSKLLDFWWMFDNFTPEDWRKMSAAWTAAGGVARTAAGDVARTAARAAAADVARTAAGGVAGHAARAAAWSAAWTAAGAAAGEIQGHNLLVERGLTPFFLPMFGIATPADIPSRPADYGLGVVPRGDARPTREGRRKAPAKRR